MADTSAMERHGWMFDYGVQSVERKRDGDETNELQRIAITMMRKMEKTRAQMMRK
jgi:hypothetical protein